MSEIERISDQLERAFRGEAWHGPSILEILTNINHTSAHTLPMRGVHTIHEIVLHMIFWMDMVIRVRNGETIPDTAPPEQDWPEVEDFTEEAWSETLDRLHTTHEQLISKVAELSDDDLEKLVPGRDFTWYILLHGIVQHNLYHAGQLAIIKSSLSKRA